MGYENISSPDFIAVQGSYCKQGKELCGDAVALHQLVGKNIFVLICCDGVSSCGQDWLASKTAVETVLNEFANPKENIKKQIGISIQKAHSALNNYPLMPHILATTLVMVVWQMDDNKLYYVSIGDSRIYKITNGQAVLLTEDDSAAEIVKKNGKTLMHEGMVAIKRPLTKTVGVSPDLQFSICEIGFNSGDCIVLTTDGVHNGMYFPDEFLKILNYKDPKNQLESYLKNCSDANRDDASLAYLFRTGSSNPSTHDMEWLIRNQADYHEHGVFEIVITEYIHNQLEDSHAHEDWLFSLLSYTRKFRIHITRAELIRFLNIHLADRQNQMIIAAFTETIRNISE